MSAWRKAWLTEGVVLVALIVLGVFTIAHLDGWVMWLAVAGYLTALSCLNYLGKRAGGAS